jgi:hypothetical protein
MLRLLNYSVEDIISNKSDILFAPNTDLPFCCVASIEHVLNKVETNGRMVVWYMGFDCGSADGIDRLVNAFCQLYKNNPTKTTTLTKADVISLLNAIDKNPYTFFKNYVYNVFRLYNLDGTFNKYKYMLDEFITNIKKIKNLVYMFASFHYPNNLKYCTLHLHLTNRYTNSVDTSGVQSNLYKLVAHHQHVDERIYLINNNYFELGKYFYFYHTIRFKVNMNNIDSIKSIVIKDADDMRRVLELMIDSDLATRSEYLDNIMLLLDKDSTMCDADIVQHNSSAITSLINNVG